MKNIKIDIEGCKGEYTHMLRITLNQIEHAINFDLKLNDGYNGFSNINIEDNILTYVNSCGRNKIVQLTAFPKISRIPIPEWIEKRTKYEQKLKLLENKKCTLEYKINHCNSKYKIMHHEEKLKEIIVNINSTDEKLNKIIADNNVT